MPRSIWAEARRCGGVHKQASASLESVVFSSPVDPSDEALERAASAGPVGAVALCAIAVAAVFGIWVAFYFLAFLPRGLMQ
jgi:hypothetical protein